MIDSLYRKEKREAITVKEIKKDLEELKRYVKTNYATVAKDLKKLSYILRDYKDRCRCSFIEFLKTIDAELRKSLKPLVPNDIIEEQIKYKPISEAALSSDTTSKSVSNFGDQSSDRSKNEPTDTKADVLTKHIQLLVNTLEDVAKRLINMTQKTEKKYYELVNPKEINSEPPSPLAAPFPDYFSFDVTNLSEENRKSSHIPTALDLNSKRSIMMKIESLDNLDPKNTEKIKERFSRFINKDLSQDDILGLFQEDEIPVSKREKLVFDIINTGREGENMVSLTDLIDVSKLNTRSIISSNLNKSNFEVSGNNYSQLVKEIQGKELTDKLDETLGDFKSLDSSIDEKMVRKIIHGRIKSEKLMFTNKNSEYFKVLPPVSIKAKGKGLKSVKNIRIRSVTPGKKNSDEKRAQYKRSKTPISKKKK